MTFVRDDHAFSRGVGAVAATDAASSRRRVAQDRADRVMARRDAILATQTLGAIRQGSSVDASYDQIVGPGRTGGGGRGVAAVGVVRPGTVVLPGAGVPTVPGRGGKPPETRPGRSLPTTLLLPASMAPVVQVIPASSSTGAGGSSGGSTSSSGSGRGGGTLAPWAPPSGGASVAPGVELDMTPVDVELVEPATEAAATPAPPKAKNNRTLMYAALGIGALLLLSRR